MGDHVAIEHGHVRIDVAGWDWMTRAELWCQARGYPVAEGFPLTHDHPWLSAEVSVLLAEIPPAGAVAIVSINGHAPRVCADVTTDASYWYDTGTVQIVCPNEHRWTWREGELLTDDEAVDPATLFNHHPAARRADGDSDAEAVSDDLDLDDDDRLYCPRCDEVCDLRLPEVPAIARLRFTVTVSDATEYRGWVLATDPDDAESIAVEMIAEGALDTDGGHLDGSCRPRGRRRPGRR